MADDTDFVVLYGELGLEPGCTMAQFKHAYRRQVGRLHPDSPGHPTDIARLQRLNRLYKDATDFHRRHGRLPGAPRPAGTAGGSVSPRAPASTPRAETEDSGLTGSRRYSRYAVLVGLLAAVLLWMQLDRMAEPTRAESLPGHVPAASDDKPDPGAGDVLAVGMDGAQVRIIQGPPLRSHETRWDYGPSWVGFRCGKVSGWYSSPLRPLRVDGSSPVMEVVAKKSSDC